MKKIFLSKIGLEIVIPILFIFSFCFYQAYHEPKPIGIILLILTTAFVLYTLLSNRYIISGKNLIITGALTRENINIENITKIEKIFNILASPASSLDRIKVFYDKGNSVLISPKNKIEFISQLKNINPNIMVKNID